MLSKGKCIKIALKFMLFIAFFCLAFSITFVAYAKVVVIGDTFWVNTRNAARKGGTGAEYYYGGYNIRLLTLRDTTYQPQYNGQVFTYCIELEKV